MNWLLVTNVLLSSRKAHAVRRVGDPVHILQIAKNFIVSFRNEKFNTTQEAQN